MGFLVIVSILSLKDIKKINLCYIFIFYIMDILYFKKKYIKYFMIILGINDGHNASVTLIVDGDIVIALEEERFTRQKGDEWFSKKLFRLLIYSLQKIHGFNRICWLSFF